MIKQFLSQFALMLLLASPFVTLVPVYVEASTTPSTVATSTRNTIDSSTLSIESRAKARLTGTSGATHIRVTITASSSSKTLYKSNRVTVRKGAWHVSASKRLPDGTYKASLFEDNKGKLTLLTTSTLTVGTRMVPHQDTNTPPVSTPETPKAMSTSSANTKDITLKVMSIALLSGGTAKAGTTVPISYLQVTNQSDATTTIAGFWVKEDGNAPVNSIIGFSSVDDKGNYRMSTGGAEGKTPFVSGQAYVPSGAVLGPHQMKLFTIKAQLSATAGQYAGTSLMLNVAGVDAPASFLGTFPIQGTTWVISN